MLSHLCQIGIIEIFRKEVACQLGTIKAVFGAVIEKFEHIELARLILERVAKGIGSQAGAQAWLASAHDGWPGVGFSHRENSEA